MAVAVTFRCGHKATVTGTAAPMCACGDTVVSRCNAPAPRFTGHVRGPSATYRPDLPAITVDLREKDATHGQ